MRSPVKSLTLAASAIALMAGSAHAEDINVGSVAGVTGPIAELVAPIVAGRNLAAEHVNSQGGLLDGNNYNLILSDSQCDPKAGVDAGGKVVNVEQVVAIVGASCSGARPTAWSSRSRSRPAWWRSPIARRRPRSPISKDGDDLVFRVSRVRRLSGQSPGAAGHGIKGYQARWP